MAFKTRMGTILFLSSCVFFVIGCDNDEVAIYEVKLKTMWDQDRFPNDYRNSFGDTPQWSPVFGQSHNQSYVLYHVGEVLRPAVQHLVQKGSIDDLMLQGEEDSRVSDQFSAPAIGFGVGETKGLVVVDSEHSLVSFISRMIPSSDWFVGVDSLNLCIDSSWVDQITLDLEPLSGGIAKKGSWENEYSEPTPFGPVTKVGARALNNRNTDLFRTSRDFPTVAKAEFTKKEVYSTEEINKLVRNDVIARLKQKDLQKGFPRTEYRSGEDEESSLDVTTKNYMEGFHDVTTKNYVEHLMELEEDPFGTPAPNLPENNVIVVTKAPSFDLHQDEDDVDDDWISMDDAVLAVAQGKKLGLNKHLPRHFRSRLHHAVNHRPHRN